MLEKNWNEVTILVKNGLALAAISVCLKIYKRILKEESFG